MKHFTQLVGIKLFGGTGFAIGALPVSSQYSPLPGTLAGPCPKANTHRLCLRTSAR